MAVPSESDFLMRWESIFCKDKLWIYFFRYFYSIGHSFSFQMIWFSLSCINSSAPVLALRHLVFITRCLAQTVCPGRWNSHTQRVQLASHRLGLNSAISASSWRTDHPTAPLEGQGWVTGRMEINVQELLRRLRSPLMDKWHLSWPTAGSTSLWMGHHHGVTKVSAAQWRLKLYEHFINTQRKNFLQPHTKDCSKLCNIEGQEDKAISNTREGINQTDPQDLLLLFPKILSVPCWCLNHITRLT